MKIESKELNEINIMRLIRKKAERAVAFKISALCVLAVGLAVLGSFLGAIAASLWIGRIWSKSRGELMKMDIEIAMIELDEEQAAGLSNESQHEADTARALAEIAGIEFSAPAGRYEGATIYGEALKEGRRYLYAGLAGPADEAGPKILIVNGMLYQLEASTVAT